MAYPLLLVAISLSTQLSSCEISVPWRTMNDGKAVPTLALGTWLGNTTQGRVTPAGEEVERAVRWALDAGYRHLDTASVYKVEDQVGRALQGKFKQGLKRDEVFVTTKLSNDRHAREAVTPALRESLQRLQLQRVDLYLVHWPLGQFANRSYDDTDYLDTWRGMLAARDLNLTSSIGVSNFNQHMLQRILDSGLGAPAVLQVEINLSLQQPELLSFCRRHDIAVMGYTPFGSLFRSKGGPTAPPPRADTPELLQLARKHNKTVPQIVLAYLLDLGVIPIPKSLTKSRIEENLDVFDVKLSADDKQLLKSYDRNYRTLPQLKWKDHKYYPFEKDNN